MDVCLDGICAPVECPNSDTTAARSHHKLDKHTKVQYQVCYSGDISRILSVWIADYGATVKRAVIYGYGYGHCCLELPQVP